MTLNEIIKCVKEVKEDYWEDDGYGYETLDYHRITTALDEAIGRLEQTRWIPVSERLPEEEGLYLVYTEEQPYVCPFDGREWHIDEVIAWMPLPEPYKTESER